MSVLRPLLPGVLAILLAAVVIGEVATSSKTIGGQLPTRLDVRAEPALGGSSSRAEAVLTTMLSRPLFDATRRPLGQTAQTVASKAAPPLPRLAGIVVDGERRSAVFALPGGSRVVTAFLGGQVDGYSVEAISARQVTLSGQGGRHVLRLSFDMSPAATRSPAVEASVPSLPVTGLPAFNGPPGLANMPPLVGSPASAGPPLNLGGIPGLAPLGTPQIGGTDRP